MSATEVDSKGDCERFLDFVSNGIFFLLEILVVLLLRGGGEFALVTIRLKFVRLARGSLLDEKVSFDEVVVDLVVPIGTLVIGWFLLRLESLLFL
jgi:hypothetical protein